jgi:hypothetical protein
MFSLVTALIYSSPSPRIAFTLVIVSPPPYTIRHDAWSLSVMPYPPLPHHPPSPHLARALRCHTCADSTGRDPRTPRVLRLQSVPRIAPPVRWRHQPRVRHRHPPVHQPVQMVRGERVPIVVVEAPIPARTRTVRVTPPEPARLPALSPLTHLGGSSPVLGTLPARAGCWTWTLTGVAHRWRRR